MKNTVLKHLIFLSFLVLSISGSSQEVLTLANAIQIAMEENYGIKVVQLQQEAAEMEVYKSNAGFGPVIDWNANLNFTGNNVNQVFIDERTVSRYARAYNPNTDFSIDLPLYDGGRMQATYERLGHLSQLSRLEGNVVIQTTIINIMATYYEINRQKETVSFLETIIKSYEERLNITEQRWTYGKGSKLDYLQSKTDLNAQLSALVTAKNNLRNAKITLNGMLNRDPNLDFETEKIDALPREYVLEEMVEKAKTSNREILLLQKSMDIRLIQEREAEALLKPQVGLGGRLGFNYSESTSGFLKTNRSIFATVGVSATWNLYDGKHNKTQIEIAKVNTEIIALQQEELMTQIINDLSFAYNQYLSDKELLTFEILNKEIAEENLNISLEKFRLGGSTILELNEAQRAYDIALSRLVEAQFSIRLSELELLRLSGVVVE